MYNNFLNDEVKLTSNFADDVYSSFVVERFGIKICPVTNPLKTILRKEILDRQLMMDAYTLYNMNFSGDILEAPQMSAFMGLNVSNYVTNINNISNVNNNTFVNSTYVHQESSPNSVWTITHNLGYYPNVRIEDLTGADIEATIDYLSLNVVQITFTQPTAGVAYLS